MEDPNNNAVGIEQPLLKEYKQLLNDPYFTPQIIECGNVDLPVKLRWGGSEDADGAALKIQFERSPEFCEVTFEEPLSLMMELNGRWFYKAPSTKTVDLMSAFFDKPLSGAAELNLNIFATPPDGTNDPSQGEDGSVNYYAQVQ